MAEALFRITTEHSEAVDESFVEDFPDLSAPVTARVAPHPFVANVEYDVVSEGVAIVEDDTAAGEPVEIDFGDVVEATGVYLRNASGQDLGVEINGVDGSVPTAVSDAVDDLDNAITAQFSILNGFDENDDLADVLAAIATASAAIDSARDALVTAVAAETSAFTLPHGGAVAYVLPAAAEPITGITLRTTAVEQAGDGEVEFRVYGAEAD